YRWSWTCWGWGSRGDRRRARPGTKRHYTRRTAIRDHRSDGNAGRRRRWGRAAADRAARQVTRGRSLARLDDLVDEAVVDGLLRAHEEVAVAVAADPLGVLPGVPAEDRGQGL